MTATEWFYRLPLLWRVLVRRRQLEEDLEDEFAFHLDRLAAEYEQQGLDAATALAAARRTMFGAMQRKEQCRDSWYLTAVEEVARDLTHAFRRARRQPAATAIAVLTIAVGIAATTSVFSLVENLLVRRPPFADPERIVWLAEQAPNGEPAGLSALNYRDWKEANHAFELLSAWAFASVTLTDGIEPTQVRWLTVSPDYFDIFGLRPVVGRAFRRDEDQPGRSNVVLLSYELWITRFGSDLGVIGRVVHVRGEPYTIIGVMPEAASMIQWGWPQLWTPLSIAPESLTRNYHRFNAYGRLKAGMSLTAARAEMARVADRLASAYPQTNSGWSARLQLYEDTLVGSQLKLSVSLLFAAASAVLVIGCLNVAGIVIADGLARDHEIATRCALGGGRRRLVRQLVTEGLLLASAGGVLGAGGAVAAIVVIKAFLPGFSAPGLGVPPSNLIALDGHVLAFSAILSVSTGILLSIVPALTTTRIDVSQAVRKAGSRGDTRNTVGRVRRWLVVGQIALTFVLVTAGTALAVGVASLTRVDVGADPGRLLTGTLPMAQSVALATPEARAVYLDRIAAAIRGVGGVQSSALTSVLPMQGAGSEVPFYIAGSAAIDEAHASRCFLKMVSPEYFITLGLTVKNGRGFDDHDHRDARHVAVVNQSLARGYFGHRDPVGETIRVPEVVTEGAARLGPLVEWEIVGVVDDERVRQLPDVDPMPGMYVPLAQSPTRHPAFIARIGPDRAAGRAIARAVATVNPEQAIADIQTLAEMRDQAIGPDRQRAYVLASFVTMALLLAGVGIYGLMRAVVVQRTREIAIRFSLGARRRRLATSVLVQAAALAAAGLGIGIVASIPVLRIIHSSVYGTSGFNSIFVGSAAGVLLAVAALGAAAPAWVAARVTPIQALREG